MTETNTAVEAPGPMRVAHPALVSVIIPVKNAAATLGDQLAALSRQTYDGAWEVILADNGSTDSTGEVIAEWRTRLPSMQVVDASSIPGPGFARNVAARAAGGDFLAMCDADDVVSPGWLSALAAAAVDADLIAGWENDATLNSEEVRAWRPPQPRQSPPRKAGCLPHATAANLGVWRDVFIELGGFHPDYRMAEDVEFCWRVQLAGYRFGYAPEAEVGYRHRTDLGGAARQFFGYGYWDARLARDTGQRSCEGRFGRSSMRSAAWLLVNAPHLAGGRGRRGRWVLRAALTVGWVCGSVRFGLLGTG